MDEKSNCMDSSVYVIIVNYNGQKYLKKCINSVMRQTYHNFKIVLVDNASNDNSVQLVKNTFSDVKIIRLKQNIGFAGGNNIGIRYALRQGTEFILLLNPDTIVEENMLDILITNADSKTVTAPKMYADKKKKKIWYAGGEIDYADGKSRHFTKVEPNDSKALDVSFVTGCCMLIHRDIIKKTGVFDDKYYLYYEDDDLCMRFMEKAVSMKYIPYTSLWHMVGGSVGGTKSPLKEYYMVRNRLYFMKKYEHKFVKSRLRVAGELFWSEIICSHDKPINNRIMALYGLMDFFMGKMGEYNR